MTDRNAGGPAAAGGMNFQAAVTSLAMVKLLDGGKLNWLNGLVTDVPVGVSSETGGPGDDICLELFGGQRVEVQVKKGLRAGEGLQSALIELAKGISDNDTDFGVLAVSSTSSATVREKLARNIVRRGEGRVDGHCRNAEVFFQRLNNEGYDAKDICQCIRIVTLHFEVGDSTSLDNGLISLERVIKKRGEATDAWNSIYAAASYMIENRGRKDLPALLKVLSSNGIEVQDDSNNVQQQLWYRIVAGSRIPMLQSLCLGCDVERKSKSVGSILTFKCVRQTITASSHFPKLWTFITHGEQRAQRVMLANQTQNGWVASSKSRSWWQGQGWVKVAWQPC